MGAKLGKTPAVAATSLRSQQLHSQRLADPDAIVSVLDIEPDSFGAWVRFDARYPLELLPFMAPEAFARDFVELNARLAAENTKEASFCAIARFVDDVLAVRYAAVGIDVRFIQQKASAGLCSRDVCFLQLLVPQAIHVKNPLPATKLVGLPFSPQRQLSAADHHVRRLRGDGAAVSPYFSSMGSRVSSSGSLAASDSSGGSVERRGSTERRDIYRAHAALHLQIPPAARTRSGSAGSPNHRGSFRFGANGPMTPLRLPGNAVMLEGLGPWDNSPKMLQLLSIGDAQSGPGTGYVLHGLNPRPIAAAPAAALQLPPLHQQTARGSNSRPSSTDMRRTTSYPKNMNNATNNSAIDNNSSRSVSIESGHMSRHMLH